MKILRVNPVVEQQPAALKNTQVVQTIHHHKLWKICGLDEDDDSDNETHFETSDATGKKIKVKITDAESCYKDSLLRFYPTRFGMIIIMTEDDQIVMMNFASFRDWFQGYMFERDHDPLSISFSL